jgi:protein involved in polysaccharide export with SLBB domain
LGILLSADGADVHFFIGLLSERESPMAGRSFRLVLVSLVFFGTASGAESGKYLIEAPDLLRILAYSLPTKAELVDGECLVQPDGNVLLGVYGNVRVHGLTLDQATTTVAKQLSSKGIPDDGLRVRVEVVKSNSKRFYVIVAGKEGEQLHSFPFDGRTTVASAVLEVEGLAAVANESGVWVGRRAGKGLKVMEVDWQAITGAGRLASNHRLEPGDRVFVGSSPRK